MIGITVVTPQFNCVSSFCADLSSVLHLLSQRLKNTPIRLGQQLEKSGNRFSLKGKGEMGYAVEEMLWGCRIFPRFEDERNEDWNSVSCLPRPASSPNM